MLFNACGFYRIGLWFYRVKNSFTKLDKKIFMRHTLSSNKIVVRTSANGCGCSPAAGRPMCGGGDDRCQGSK